MTPSEKWVLGLFIVYSIPAFPLGVGITLLFVRLGAANFLSPARTFERPAHQGPSLVVQPVRLR
jgi:hypothetical protein